MPQFYFFLGHEQFQPETLVKHAQLAEAAGFDGVMVSEHFQPWVDDKGASGFAFSTLGAIAQATAKVKLMTTVVTPLFRYHPAVVAQAAATIDRLSGGRFELGVGSGENINEAPLGYELPAYAERSARLKEALEIMHRLLAGEQLTFHGEYYQVKNAKLYSPPLQHVPLYVAAAGPKTATLARESADGVITSVKDVDEARDKVIQPYLDGLAARPAKVIANRWSVLAANDDDAYTALGAWRGLRAPSRNSASNPAQLRQEADELPKADILSRYSRARKVEDLVSIYEPLITQLGADDIGIFITSLDQEKLITMVGRELLPVLRQLKPKGGTT